MKLRVYQVALKDGSKAVIEAHNISSYANLTNFYETTEATQVLIAAFPTDNIKSVTSNVKPRTT